MNKTINKINCKVEKHKISYRVQDLCNITKDWYSEYKKNSWESTEKKANTYQKIEQDVHFTKRMSKWLITIWKVLNYISYQGNAN